LCQYPIPFLVTIYPNFLLLPFVLVEGANHPNGKVASVHRQIIPIYHFRMLHIKPIKIEIK
jgi:hypothetical protein